jgi:biopolymer transport protein ExbD
MKIARKKMQCEVPSVAMGDIAFNLLIFFVILAQATDDSHLAWQPAAAPKVESAGNARISVLVDSNKKVYLNGGQVSLAQLKTELEKELQGAVPGQRRVLLKIDKETTADLFQPIIESVSEAGGELVHILTEKNPK